MRSHTQCCLSNQPGLTVGYQTVDLKLKHEKLDLDGLLPTSRDPFQLNKLLQETFYNHAVQNTSIFLAL